jgi:hypothetical protein
MGTAPKATGNRPRRRAAELGRKRKARTEPELFPVPEVDPRSTAGARLAELLELEERFADGEMTWPDYSQRLRELAVQES